MKLITCKSNEELANKVYETFLKYLDGVQDPVIGFATGSSPISFYNLLIKKYKEGLISFKDFKSFNLDEYLGLAKTHSQSYAKIMRETLFNHVDFDDQYIFNLNGDATDMNEEINRYESLLEKYRIDIQILGIGSNGHIAFNEPQTPLNMGVHVIDLDKQTIEDNSRFFSTKSEVPKKAITMGPKNILHAKKIILIAQGYNKAQAVKDMFWSDITKEVPASILQLHRHVTVITDKEASALIK